MKREAVAVLLLLLLLLPMYAGIRRVKDISRRRRETDKAE